MAKEPGHGPTPYRDARRRAWGMTMEGHGNVLVSQGDTLKKMLMGSPDYSDGLTNTEYRVFMQYARTVRKIGLRLRKWGKKVSNV